MLADIVSKNGNLLLSVPVRGDGTIDADETAFLDGMAKWMAVNSEAIFSTRPWEIYGEGPSTEENPEAGHFGGARDVRSKPYTAADLRFTVKDGALYAIGLEVPADKNVLIKSLATHSSHAAGRKVTAVSLLGYDGKLSWTQDESGLRVQLPAVDHRENTFALKIEGVTAG
jgi:alpha-L-fucosidase